ncbi:MAG: PAS domain S-box protein [Syntrophaceae bacterium]|nr:PAS domain S-box protein [Syntrophaceae bacterium]
MQNQNEGMEKLLTIEKTLMKELNELQRGFAELKELEAKNQKFIETLRESEKRYKIFLGSIPLRLFVIDKNLQYTYCSQTYAQDLKIKPEEIVGRTDHDLFPKELAEKYTADNERIMETGNAESFEDGYVIGTRDHTVQMNKTPIRDEKENILGLLGIFWDISEQKRKQEELEKRGADLEELLALRTAELHKTNERFQEEESKRKEIETRLRLTEEEYNTLFENAESGLAMIDEDDMTIIKVNKIFEKIFGISREEVEDQKKLIKFIPEEDQERVQDIYSARRTRADALPKGQEYWFIDKQGNRKDISLTMALLPEAKKVAVSLLDLTERNQLKGNLRSLEEKYRGFVENSMVGIAVIQDGEFKFINPQGIEMFGRSPEEFPSRRASEFIHPDDRERFELQVKRINDGGPPQLLSLKISEKNGNQKWLENRISLIHWEGRPASLHLMTDITDRKKALDDLFHSVEPFLMLAKATQKVMSIAKE